MTALNGSARLWIGLAVMFAVSGCETIGNPIAAINGQTASPDEFQVLARKPLKMPGTLDLPEPRLGERSPLEPDPITDATIALLGVPNAVPKAQPSAGEQALLSAANASASNPELSAQLEQEVEQRSSSGTYQVPLITEVLGSSDDAPVEDALVPGAEARRLQVEGAGSTPVDPTALPEAQSGSRSEDVETFYNPNSRTPENRLPNRNTTTAF